MSDGAVRTPRRWQITVEDVEGDEAAVGELCNEIARVVGERGFADAITSMTEANDDE